jgi:hypothetical protein
MPGPLDLIRLKDGFEAPDAAVRTTMINMQHVAETEPLALIELTAACRNPAHKAWPGATGTLTRLALVQDVHEDGTLRIHEIVRHVVLSAVEGDDELNLTLCSPVAP